MKRIGMLGGSFDPVHYGHLILAESAREQLRLDQFLLVPAATSPLKPHGPIASNQARLEMLELAIGGTPGITVDPWELKQGGTSYTIETIRELSRRESNAEIFLIVGSDQVPLLSAWKDARRISELATWAFVNRAGFPSVDFSQLTQFATDQQVAASRAAVIEMPAMELSSTELRIRVAESRSLRFRTPRAVEEYIRAQCLYH